MEETYKDVIKEFDTLKRNKEWIANIDIDFFINFTEYLINRNKELEKHYRHEQEYINGEVFSAKQLHYIEDNYIDKDKIREILEDIDNSQPVIAELKLRKLVEGDDK